MSRGPAAALAAALVLVAVPAAARADGTPTAPSPPPAPPTSFVVALSLEDPLLQAGVVRGRDVILARGFEVELSRVLARRLGGHVERFVYVPSAARLLVSNAPGWHLALGGVERSRGARSGADLTVPYLTTDVAVVARLGLDRPRRLADLRAARLCAVRASAGARAAATVHPRAPVSLVAGSARLLGLVRTGACDAALVPATQASRFLREGGRTIGRAVGRIPSGDGVGAVVPRGTGLDVRAVDRELGRLRRDGTLGRLARAWLGLDPAALRVLR